MTKKTELNAARRVTEIFEEIPRGGNMVVVVAAKSELDQLKRALNLSRHVHHVHDTYPDRHCWLLHADPDVPERFAGFLGDNIRIVLVGDIPNIVKEVLSAAAPKETWEILDGKAS